jgi:hypothetical protein
MKSLLVLLFLYAVYLAFNCPIHPIGDAQDFFFKDSFVEQKKRRGNLVIRLICYYLQKQEINY